MQSINLVYAEQQSDVRHENSIKALIAFGIYDSDFESVKTNRNMTRKEASLWVYRVLNQLAEYNESYYSDVTEKDDYFNAIMSLSERGIFSGCGNGKFEPERTIKYSEFVKVLIDVLGYKTVAVYEGDYPQGYIKLASDLGLNKNVIVSNDKPLTVGEAGQILFNALHLEIAGYDINSKGVHIGNSAGDTLLSEYHDIYLKKGRMTSNSITGLTNPDNYTANTVRISDSQFDIGFNDADQFLGMNVTAYYKVDTNDNETVVYIYADNNKQTILNLNSFSIEKDISTRTELNYYNDKDKLKKVKISDVADIIYNGKAYPDLDDIYPSDGEIKLLDSNNDNIYDVLFITDYQIVVVDGYSPSSKTITSRYALEDSSRLIYIDDDDIVEIYGMEEELTLEDISTDDVLMFAESKTGRENYKRIIISEKQVTGNLKSIQDDEYQCGDETYKLSNAYLTLLANNYISVPNLSKEYTFLIDIYGRIVAYNSQFTGRQYGYFRKYVIDDGIDEKISMRILCQDGQWRTIPVREKLKVNNETMKAEIMKEMISRYQMIRFEIGKKDEIVSLQTATYSEPSDSNFNALIANDTFRYSKRDNNTGNNVYLGNSNSIYNQFYLNNDAIVFSIPKDTDAEESLYFVTNYSAFSSEAPYEVEIYDVDKFRYSSVLVNRVETGANATLRLRRADSYFFVKKSVTELVDDEIVSVVYGIQNGVDWSYTSTEMDTFDSLKRGDIIRTTYNGAGQLNSYKLIHSYGNEDVYSNISNDGVNAADANIYGKVIEIDSVNGKILVDDGTVRAYRIPNSSRVTLFNTESEEILSSSLADIKPGDYICMRMYFSIVDEIAVYSY